MKPKPYPKTENQNKNYQKQKKKTIEYQQWIPKTESEKTLFDIEKRILQEWTTENLRLNSQDSYTPNFNPKAKNFSSKKEKLNSKKRIERQENDFSEKQPSFSKKSIFSNKDFAFTIKRFEKKEAVLPEKSFQSNEKHSAKRKDKIRLNRYIALSGLCSRRDADELIEAGRVKVNGLVVKQLGTIVTYKDEITVDGKTIQPERFVYIVMNKPKNVITSVEDPEGRQTVMDLLGDQVEERVFPVGRLDRNTTGLLLLTNDGALAKKLTHPSHNIKKLYKVKLDQK
ncbi:MAG: pseudouridine synthase, partial [Bacteroidia bacterium]|nr:pseudouridine synthase [Bacteroidia bacterium]